jgi:hypothetical protein
MAKYSAIILVLIFAAVSNVSGAVAAFNPIADTYVSEADPNTNYGTSTILRTNDDSAASKRCRSYMRFSISGLTGPVVSAKLILTSQDAMDDATIYEVAANWSESSLTWNNDIVTWGPAIGTLTAIPSYTQIELDVTPIVSSNGVYSFGIKTTSLDNEDWYSRERTNLAQVPTLEITTSETDLLGTFGWQWLNTDCSEIDFCFGVDFDRNGTVDLHDFAMLGKYWLDTSGHYVTTFGDDNNPGTFLKPFATVQKAVDEMLAGNGDTCYIRGGKYHGAVIANGLKGTAEQPITITSFNDEQAIIAGTTPITTDWEVHSGNIWKTTISQDIWQLFVNGDMMTAARWPNIEKDWDEPDDSSGFDPTPGSYWDKDGTQAHLTDLSSWGHFDNDNSFHDLAALGVSVEDAMLVGYHCMVSGNDVFTEQITSHVAGESDFLHTTVNWAAGTIGSQSISGARYYIEADLDLLDAPGEWFYDMDTGQLYVWFEDSGSPYGRDIEGKTEHFVLDLTNCEYLNFSGIQLFGGAFDLSSTYDTTFEDCKFIYPSYGRRMLKVIKAGVGYVIHDKASAYNRTGGGRNPANLTWRNCEFANFEGCGLYIRTHGGNLIDNCYFHNGQILGVVYGTASDHKGSGTTIRRSTFHTLGLQNATKNGKGGLLEYNRIYNMQFDGDFSASQTSTGAQEGTIHRYNWIHDCRGRNGIRFDGDPAGIRAKVHHVVSYHNMRGFRLKGDQHQIYNLTGIGNTPKNDINIAFEKFYGYDPNDCMEYSCRIAGRRGSDPYHGSENSIAHNLAGQDISNWPLTILNPADKTAIWHGNDLDMQLKNQLCDPDNLDFRPCGGSELIDTGEIVPGITDGFLGSAPDIGAYEFGSPNYWIPGCKFKKASTPIPPDGSVTVKFNADLMWLEGREATSHNVYFGIDPNSLAFMGNQTTNIFDPGNLVKDIPHYWRIDTVTADGVVTGDLWTFTHADPTAGTATFYASDDAHTVNGSDNNDGSKTWLPLRGSSYKAYVKVDVSGMIDVSGATLRLKMRGTGGTDTTVHSVTDNSWNEDTITGNNKPNMSDPLATVTDMVPYEWYDFDVSSFVTANGVYSFGLKTTSGNWVDWYSKEGGNSPELVVSGTVSDNHAPYLRSVSFASENATEGVEYSDNISEEATDPDGDVITFSKAGGPEWLIVSPDGTLSGMPGTGDVGGNTFTIRVEDPSGAYDEGIMTIGVLAAP